MDPSDCLDLGVMGAGLSDWTGTGTGGLIDPRLWRDRGVIGATRRAAAPSADWGVMRRGTPAGAMDALMTAGALLEELVRAGGGAAMMLLVLMLAPETAWVVLDPAVE